ncbi:MAG: carbamate kinase [Candidatus Lokiarchaeota archaeon]|nr:carbamate kinase [Candidatus Lokiarchaeota archaeon]
MKTIVIALGGNALIKRGQKGTADEQFRNLQVPIKQIARMSTEYNIIITHGNGPQVGNLLIQQETCESDKIAEMPLEVLVALTQGQIGFMIESTLDNELMKLENEKLPPEERKLFLTVLTYVKVSQSDPAFKNPTKPIGPAYDEPKDGYVQTAKGWRRVVPSPKPLKIYQYREIKKLLEMNFIVIACGGGGIPVVKEKVFDIDRDLQLGERLTGVEAVIDKDLASAKLGEQIDADILLIATDEEKVAINYKQPNQRFLDKIPIAKAKEYMKQGHFPAGSMGPKVQAAINFLEAGGERVIITSIEKIEDALNGKAGTEFYLN